MISISSLENIHQKGLFGNYEGKDENELITISEIKNLLIVQIVKYKKSVFSINNINIEGIKLPNETLKVNCNNNLRILWCGPDNWLLISTNKELLNDINKLFNSNDFAVTDLSHSRTVIELVGKNAKEILKKGCPFDFDNLQKNNCVNSVFNGITITIDMLNDNPNKIRLFSLRSFGESFYHSVTDACLEDGFKAI
ncbi:MAG: sarcosine oxidase [Candidatus Pelagibacterales bacterium]|nr:MAG: sarcosine oxidase [Pelagibacterales bacterium]|tara:strand:- start:95 stop:682 length:588 start_codon:yes stop_codon:yes gene_type:complete